MALENKLYLPPFNPNFSASCYIFACLFLVFLYAGDEMSHKSGQLWTPSIKRNVVSRSSRPSAILRWSRKTREQSACFNWLKATNTRLPIVHTSNTSLPTRKKLVKKLARIETSSICRQQFANLFADCFCAVHTHQLEFANIVCWQPVFSPRVTRTSV